MSSPTDLPSPPAEPPGLALALLPAVALMGAALLCEAIVDLPVTDLFYDRALHRFPLRHDWVYEQVLHEGGKLVMVAVGVGCAVGWLSAFRWSRLAPWRWPLLYTGLCIGLTSSVVATLKAVSHRACPWALARYGGTAPLTTCFADASAPLRHGHGWPAGHAAPALALCGMYLVARARGIRPAGPWLLPGFLMGGFFAWVQLVRGAHFLSHNLWSAAIAWLVACGLAWGFARLGWRLDGAVG